jgi:acetyl esterase
VTPGGEVPDVGRAQELLPVDRSAPPPVLDMIPRLTDEARAQLEITERWAPVPGGPDVRLVVYRPLGADGSLPVVLSIHGGAFCSLSPDDMAGPDGALALTHLAVVVAVDYRLAPEHPFPAGPDDCYAALLWTVDHADELGVDVDRLVVTGGSAGGALSAAVCLMARDRGGPRIAFQALNIPVIDDRLDTPSMAQAVDAPGFNSSRAEGMWLHYLGEDRDVATTSPYAAPGRAEDLTGLPPAFILTNGLDPLRDEGITYGMRLLAAGVPVELHNVPGAYHGAPPLDLAAVRRGQQAFLGAIGDALHPAGHPVAAAT